MFVGHFGVALGAKKLAPTVSLGTLFMAALLADLLWLPLVLGGAEAFQIRIDATAVMPLEFLRFPYSHSLLGLTFAAIVFCAGCALFGRTNGRMLLTLGGLVLSHWLLDFVVHAPDLPLGIAGGDRFGLGLWTSIPATLLVEGMLLAGGLALYLSSTRPLNQVGEAGPWVLTAVLVATYALVIFGPRPQSHTIVTAAVACLWLLVAAGYLIDHHRNSNMPRRDTRLPPDPRATTTSSHVRRKRSAARPGARARH
jgi:hypothetical protein